MSANQNQQKIHSRMCKSPSKTQKSLELTNYEILNTNCTMVGSNNLNLDSKLKMCAKPLKSPDSQHILKKPQSPRAVDFLHGSIVSGNAKFANFAPSFTRQTSSGINGSGNGGISPGPGSTPGVGGYPATPSPSYSGSAASPYSPGMKSPAPAAAATPSPQNIRPPTPQPILPQSFQHIQGQNLVQIIHTPNNNNNATFQNHPVIARQTIIASPSVTTATSASLTSLKIKPPQNILPKPPVSGVTKPRATPGPGTSVPTTNPPPQPTAPTAATQLVLPGNPAILPAAGGGTFLFNQMPLLVQPGAGGVQLILRPGTPSTATSNKLTTSPQVILQPAPATLLQHNTVTNPTTQTRHPTLQQVQPQQLVRVLTANGMLSGFSGIGGVTGVTPTYIAMQQPSVATATPALVSVSAPVPEVSSNPATSTGITVTNKLASSPPVTVVPQPSNQHNSSQQIINEQLPPPKKKPKKKKKNKEPKLDLANIMKLSGIGDEDDVLFESDASEASEPLQKAISKAEPSPSSSITNSGNSVNNINEDLSKKWISSETDNLTEKMFGQSQLSVQQSLSDINAINQNLAQIGLINQNTVNFLGAGGHITTNNLSINNQSAENQNLANILQVLNQQGQNFSLVNGHQIQQTQHNIQASNNYQKFPGLLSTNTNFATSSIASSISQNLANDTILGTLAKSQSNQTFTTQKVSSTPPNSVLQHFNIPNAIPNIQFCNNNPNLILNQTGNILTPNLSNFATNITINNSLIPSGNLTLQNNLVPNFLPTNLVQPNPEVNTGFGPNVQRTGGFKLALSEDGRLILQHDPTLNQDIQSQLLLQSIFGINLQGGNLVLSNSTVPSMPKPAPLSEPIKKTSDMNITKTTSTMQTVTPSVKTAESQPESQHQSQPQSQSQPQPQGTNNLPYVVNLTPDQLEILKRNGQLTVNGQTIFMHRPNVKEPDKNINRSPKIKALKKKNQLDNNKIQKPIIQEHLLPKAQNIESTQINKLPTPTSNVQTTQIKQKLPDNQTQTELFSATNVQTTKSEPLIIVKQTTLENKQTKTELQQLQLVNGTEHQINMEQFLSNLNINPTNLGQLISQKLSHELSDGVDHKIVNIGSSTPGQIVAKVDIRPDGMQPILSHSTENSSTNNNSSCNNSGNDLGDVSLPPLISMNVKSDNDVFTASNQIHSDLPQQQQQQSLPSQQLPLPALIFSETPVSESGIVKHPSTNSGTVYQRVQTIQLTPQKQQLLKNIQVQIHALTARLQQIPNDSTKLESNSSESEIHTALRRLFIEQQKILATGKVIPNVINNIETASSCVSTTATTTISTTSTTKSNGTFLTSLLQQPVVTHNQNQKVFYHNGNQIITLNSSQWQQSQQQQPLQHAMQQNSVQQSVPQVAITSASPMSPNPVSTTAKIKKSPIPLAVPISVSTTNSSPTKTIQPIPITIKPTSVEIPSASSDCTKRLLKTTYSKSQLIEQQLTTDQNGAVNPDITTPFASKADACKRLVRYHCYNQPVLSQKDLDKADEIFELTARHFIEKFRMMVNKYKYLLFKESMREVQTSELMMIDRMFLAEEQQSFLKLQSDVKLQNDLELQENNLNELYRRSTPIEHSFESTDANTSIPFETDIKPNVHDFTPDDIIQELEDKSSVFESTSEPFTLKTEDSKFDSSNADFNIKCGLNYFSDESCDSGNFRVYESPKDFDEFINKNEYVSSSEKLRDKDKSAKSSGMEGYNTTKIIGNFEIEINNSQESYTKNFRQKIIENKVDNCIRKDENFIQKDDDYDEWLCIQRELGYFPDTKGEDQKVSEQNNEQNNIPDKSMKLDNDIFKKSHKRSSSDSNRLETLKKYRVDKHNSKVKKSGSIIGEVKFEVRIEHKKVFPNEQKPVKCETTNDHVIKQPMKRSQCFDYAKNHDNDLYNCKRTCSNQNYKLSETSPCNSFHSVIKQEEEASDANVTDMSDRSIDEQVQSAIDSILNLQQISSMSEKNEDSAKSTLSKKDSSDFYSKTITDEFSDATTDTLDEAVKSILS